MLPAARKSVKVCRFYRRLEERPMKQTMVSVLVLAALAYSGRLFLTGYGVVFTNSEFGLLFVLAMLCLLYQRRRDSRWDIS
jgi:hypothetical protein